MYRRLISTSVLAAFVVAQLAAMPHAHAHGSPIGHNAAPHVHLGAANSTHQHEHGHAHGHRHVAPTIAHRNVSHECGLSGAPDHDADAVYLPKSISPAPSSGTDPCQLGATLTNLHFAHGTLLPIDVAASTMSSPRPPGERAPGCDLCLTLRALRI